MIQTAIPILVQGIPKTASRAILCVDDEDSILDSLKEQLKRSIILSDWLMPGIRGDELLVRVHQRYPQIITIMLTGQADQTAIDRAHNEANLHKCLRKPWREEDLVNTILAGLSKI